MEQAAIQKIFIDRSEDDATTSEQFAKIGTPDRRNPPYYDFRARLRRAETVRPIGIPNPRVQRKFIDIEAPVFFRDQRQPPKSLKKFDASTVRVLIATFEPYSGRRTSLPTP
jgi:hypothetical protein